MTTSRADQGADVLLHDQLLTVSQAGEYLQTGERFVRRLIAERRIAYVKLGKYVRLQRSTLDAFIDAGRVPSGSQTAMLPSLGGTLTVDRPGRTSRP